MGEVLLDGKYYTVKDGTIQRRNINPRAARFETGVPGYSSFTQGSAQAWKGLRGGIGHQYYNPGSEECYWSDGLDCTHHSGIVLGPLVNTAGTFGVAPVKIINFSGSVYAIGHQKIAKWVTTGTPGWDTPYTSFNNPIDAIVVTDSTNTYLVVSSATAAIYTINGSSWNTLTGCAGYLTAFDNKLYGYSGGILYNSPAKASDGTWDVDGTWTSCYYLDYVGTPYRLFTARSQTTDEPLMCLSSTEALWTVDPWVQEMYPYLKLTGHTNAGRTGMFWNSYIWVSTGPGIKKIAGNMITDVGPDQDDGLPAGYQGYISDMCVASDGSWMVFAVNGGTTDKSSIFKRHGTIGGNQQIYSTSTASAITCLNYSPSSMTGMTNGRLWWGEGTNVKYCMMPDFNTDVTQISSYEYIASSGKLVFPIFAPLEAFNKVAIRVRATTKGCSDNLKFNVSYRTDANCFTAVGSNWTPLGSFTTSPNPTALDFGSGVGVTFYQIQLAIDGATNSSTSTPELLSLELDYDVGTKRLRGWSFPIAVTQHNADEILTNLYTSQDKDTLLAFYPSGDSTNGTLYYVKIENISENIEWGMFRRNGIVSVTVEELIRG